MRCPSGTMTLLMCGAFVFAALAADRMSTISAQGQGQGQRGYRRPTVVRGSPGNPLTPPGQGRAAERARQFVRESASDVGLSPVQVDDLVVTGESTSAASGIVHVFLRQRIDGVEVSSADANLSVGADGRILTFGHSFVPDAEPTINRRAPGIAPADAAAAAARHVGLDPVGVFEVSAARGGAAQETVLTDGGVAEGAVVAKLVFQPVGPRELLLAWQVDLEERSGEHLWRMTVDAATGEVLQQDDYTDHDNWDLPANVDTTFESATSGGTTAVEMASPTPVLDGSSYRVFALPAESPNDADTSLVPNPADASASPFGWHDTDGTAGPEFTITRGNNVAAYFDQDRNNQADAGTDADGGAGLTFDFSPDLSEHAQNYRDTAVTNLFYWNNIYHDVMWRFGFDEASGNFQANNYGRGGGQGDYVRAEAADGNGTNNANFSTPAADAGTPRMQMYLWPGNQFGSQNQVVVAGTAYNASWARFSPAPSVAGTSGPVFDAGDGCAAAAYAGAPAAFIALVTGGNEGCQNITKAREAEAAGAAAVVVALNGEGAAPVLTSLQGSLSTPGPGIPVASITQADGGAIRAAIGGGPQSALVRKHPDHPGIRDGDLEAGIIIHEYGHGVSNRLTGGPGINCLSGNEQMGEGWSDFYAIAILLNPALDDPQGPRGMGPYALFQNSRQGNGIRPRPYSRNMEIQPFTYDSIKTNAWLIGGSLAAPHGIGHGWAAVLWDMTWDLIDKHGFNEDVYGDWDSGGNNRALQYVTDGLKFQGCGPGFVAGRNGILAAVEALGNEDRCTVWAAFARRGLGYGAVQGTTARDDNTEAFDTHPACRRDFQTPVATSYGTLNAHDAGSGIPLRFMVGQDLGADILATNSPFSRRVDCNTLQVPSIGATITPREYPEPTAPPGGSGLTVNAQGVYHYNWKSLDEWAGTCREVVVTRKDGVQHRAFFQFVAPE